MYSTISHLLVRSFKIQVYLQPLLPTQISSVVRIVGILHKSKKARGYGYLHFEKVQARVLQIDNSFLMFCFTIEGFRST